MIKHVQKQRRRWPVVAGSVFLALLLLLGGTVSYAFIKPLPPITYTAATLPSYSSAVSPAITWPAYGQSAYGAMGFGVLETNGEQKAYPIASIAKVLTAMCVMQKKPLKPGEQGEVITITQTDVDFYNQSIADNGSRVPVVLGEQITEYQALQALLLPSANNMASTLAVWAFGSIANFNTYANAQAKAMGLSSMAINDPSGLDNGTVSSAQDLVKLGMKAMADPVIAEIVGQKSAVIPVAGTVFNYNMVLGQEGNVGIKTGNNSQNLGAFLFAAKRKINGTEAMVIGAIMDAPDLFKALNDSLPVVTSGDGGYETVNLIAQNQTVGTFNVPWQGSVKAVTADAASFFTWKKTEIKVVASDQKVPGAVNKGYKTGSVVAVNSLNKSTESVDVRTDQKITKPGLWWRIRNIF